MRDCCQIAPSKSLITKHFRLSKVGLKFAFIPWGNWVYCIIHHQFRWHVSTFLGSRGWGTSVASFLKLPPPREIALNTTTIYRTAKHQRAAKTENLYNYFLVAWDKCLSSMFIINWRSSPDGQIAFTILCLVIKPKQNGKFFSDYSIGGIVLTYQYES